MGEANIERDFISDSDNFMFYSLAHLSNILVFFFAIFGAIQKQSVKLSNHQLLYDGMRLRIAGRLETCRSQVLIPREFIVTPSVVFNLCKQLNNTKSIERKAGRGRPRATKANEDHYIFMVARSNRGATASNLSPDLFTAT